MPGFDKYSVIFAPDMGKDVSMQLQFVQLDSHVREDHPRNLRSLFTAFSPDAVVDAAPYAFQKQPNWFSAPPTRWHIRYLTTHRSGGGGLVDPEVGHPDGGVYSGDEGIHPANAQTH